MDDPAVRAIVGVHVRCGNHRALENLRMHRGILLANLIKTLGGPYDVRKPITQLEDEIAIIDAGVAKLKPAAAA